MPAKLSSSLCSYSLVAVLYAPGAYTIIYAQYSAPGFVIHTPLNTQVYGYSLLNQVGNSASTTPTRYAHKMAKNQSTGKARQPDYTATTSRATTRHSVAAMGMNEVPTGASPTCPHTPLYIYASPISPHLAAVWELGVNMGRLAFAVGSVPL